MRTKHRTFDTSSPISKGIIDFLHDITKDAKSTVEQMRQANDKYFNTIKKKRGDCAYTPTANHKTR